MCGVPATLDDLGFAKVNLTLHVVGRRPDGYHEIDSLVAFARVGDRLSFAPGGPLTLDVKGPFAAMAGTLDDNLVIKAAHALERLVGGLTLGRFALEKRLPVAAGLGGGSADAAAALRLLARANRIPAADPRLFAAARTVGADVPVCLDPRPRLMGGIGDMLSAPLDLPPLPAVLANPGVPVATREVFAALDAPMLPAAHQRGPLELPPHTVRERIARGRNDLEPVAVRLCPAIADVLAALRGCAGCTLARMSGSGATCFALFEGEPAAQAAARALGTAHPQWWIAASALGAGSPAA